MAHRTASLTAEVQLHEVLRLRLHRGALFVRERYQTALRQIPELAYGGIARELRDVFEDAGDTPDVSLLHIEVERPRDGILAVGDRVEVRHHAVDVRALDFVGVLLEEAVTEYTELARVGDELLDDEVVVLTGVRVVAVVAQHVTSREVLVARQRGDPRKRLAAAFHDELVEGVARARRRRRSKHIDVVRGQRRVDLRPLRIGIRHELLRAGGIGNLFREREVDVT